MSSPSEAAGTSGPADYARRCIEEYVRGRNAPPPPDHPFYGRRAACFVSIKRHGCLRGCVGTLAPVEAGLGDEIKRNAYSAAFQDSRFSDLREEELEGLTCSVDVLSPSEPCTLADLDPSRYGVIVAAGSRRGVLLPALETVDTAVEQVAIALEKAGIRPGESFATERFTVARYAEGEPPREQGDDVD